jgi:hypothetical protein
LKAKVKELEETQQYEDDKYVRMKEDFFAMQQDAKDNVE